jgi:hypothetical protein
MTSGDRVADVVEHLVGSVAGGTKAGSGSTASSLNEKRSCLRLRVIGLI